MKLNYEIKTILKYNNKELDKSGYIPGIEAIILANKCLCIYNDTKVFIFNKIYRLIGTINLDNLYIYKNNMISILKYPNLFALREDTQVNLYEIEFKKKKKIILKRRIKIPKDYSNKIFTIFSLSSADILYFFQENFFIYNIKNETFIYKKFLMPIEKKYETLNKYKQIIKIIEYKENELIILLRDIIYGKEDQSYNCEVYIINSIVLYDRENAELKKTYITNEDIGESNTYLGSFHFYYNRTTFSNDQNIVVINNSIVYLKDHQIEYKENNGYTIYIINILNGDIKYKFEDNEIEASYKEFEEFYNFQKSIYLCDNLFLYNGYELKINKNGIEQNKIDIIYKQNSDDQNNNNNYYIKLDKNLFLLYNFNEIKIFQFYKK